MFKAKCLSYEYKYSKLWKKLLFTYSFLMAFPAVVFFGLNASLFVFWGMLVFLWKNSRISILGLSKFLQWVALFFAFGALASVFFMPEEQGDLAFQRALSVLPNYLYWSILLIFLIQNRHLLDLNVIYSAIFWGVAFSVFYYLFLQSSLKLLPVFKKFTPNNFSFILICYTPLSVFYLKNRKGNIWALLYLLFVSLVLLQDGRRSGFVLVLAGGLAVLFLSKVSWRFVFSGGIALSILFVLYHSPLVENFIYNSSDRIYTFMYKTDEVFSSDPSYLIRVAMVKKGLAIYAKHPVSGIGLNNFTKYSIAFDRTFPGAKLVVFKRGIQHKSSHNSYINVLAEGGLLLFVPFVLILLWCLLYFGFNYFSMPEAYRPPFIALTAMAVHLYFITAIVNVFAWFLIGLCCSLVYRR